MTNSALVNITLKEGFYEHHKWSDDITIIKRNETSIYITIKNEK